MREPHGLCHDRVRDGPCAGPRPRRPVTYAGPAAQRCVTSQNGEGRGKGRGKGRRGSSPRQRPTRRGAPTRPQLTLGRARRRPLGAGWLLGLGLQRQHAPTGGSCSGWARCLCARAGLLRARGGQGRPDTRDGGRGCSAGPRRGVRALVGHARLGRARRGGALGQETQPHALAWVRAGGRPREGARRLGVWARRLVGWPPRRGCRELWLG